MISRNSRLTFGKHKKHKRKLKDCDDGYLKWMVANLSPEFAEWAKAAEKELALREKEDTMTGSLEDQADEFLRKHNIDPKKYKT